MKKLAFIFILFSFLSKAANPPSIIFKENKGQWPEKVLFGAEFLNTKFYVNKTGFNYCVYNYEELSKAYAEKSRESVVHGHNYEVKLEGAELNSFKTKTELSEYFNYFLGNDRSKWTNHVKACRFLEFNEVYEGIDLHIYSNSLNLKYDFIVSPKAHTALIKLNYRHTNGLEIKNKELIVHTSAGDILEKEPFAYQDINGERKIVKCEYRLGKDNTVEFNFPDGYDENHTLIIDPTVMACSYSGSSVFSYANACTYDEKGNGVVVGTTDIGYPTTIGAFQVNFAGKGDIFVSKYNGTGTTKFFSTYIGSTGSEEPLDINVTANEIIIVGRTDSTDYPHTINAFDTVKSGTNDIIITKIDTTGSILIASTFVGGSLDEICLQFGSLGYPSMGIEMYVDTQKNVYVVSNTRSPDFPITTGAYKTIKSGSTDAVVFKMNSSLSVMLWSTYLGGSNIEDGLSIKPDGKGGVYVHGTTASYDLPVTAGAYQSVKTGSFPDMYVSHLNSTGSALIASTFVGTATEDIGYLMDVDPDFNVFLCGQIGSSSFLVPSPGTYSMANTVNTIYKLDSSLSTLGFKTKFGTLASVVPRLYYTAFKVDSCQNIYIGGMAYPGYPTTPNQFQPFGGGATDMYMVVFNSNCSSLRFGSYYGGNAPPPFGYGSVGEQAWGISHFDSRGKLYMAVSASENLPTTPGAYAPAYSNTTTATRVYNDAFLKVDLGTFVNAFSSYGPTVYGCPPPFSAQFVSSTNTGSTYWNFGDGNTSTQSSVSHTYTSLGIYNVLLLVTDTTTCNKTDSIKSVLNIIDPTYFDLGDDVYLCFNSKVLLQPNISALSYSWSTGQTFPNINVSQPGIYTLTITNQGGCKTSNAITVLIGEDKLSDKFPNVVTPNGDNVNDVIDFKKYKLEEMEFVLFDRWGKERFRINDQDESLKPDELENGTYYYTITYRSSCTGKYGTNKGFISIYK
jgi:gliding motility-associated-like protein